MKALCAIALPLLLASALPAVARAAPETTVAGTVEAVDPAARTLAVRDGLGGLWRYTVDRDAGIDLESLRPGDRVRVTIARPTPPTMISAADRLRKGDAVRKIPF